MAAVANQFSLASGKAAANLQTLFSKMSHVFFSSKSITASDFKTNGLEMDIELPVLSDGVNFNMGEPDKTETKLTTGIIWTSRADKGDSDISFQVASIDGIINSIFMNQKSAAYTGVKFGGAAAFGIPADNVYAGVSYSSDVKKVTGSLLLTDDNAQTIIVLPNVEMYAGLVVSDGDNPAYFNVSVTPTVNADGSDIVVFNLTSGSTVDSLPSWNKPTNGGDLSGVS